MPVSVKNKTSDQPLAAPGEYKDEQLISSARRTLDIESKGLRALEEALTDGLSASFAQAVRIIRDAHGRIIVSGIGKSGHVEIGRAHV